MLIRSSFLSRFAECDQEWDATASRRVVADEAGTQLPHRLAPVNLRPPVEWGLEKDDHADNDIMALPYECVSLIPLSVRKREKRELSSLVLRLLRDFGASHWYVEEMST